MTIRSVLARWAAPLLLVVIAVVQIARVHAVDQSSWSGVGMGMFATIDGEDTRWVRGRLLGPGQDEDVVFPPADLADEAFDARVVPTAERVRDLARRWAARLDGPATLVVEVWGPRFHRSPTSVTAELLEAEEVEVPDRG